VKALVLAAGRGHRLGDWTEARNKCLIPVRGRPLIQYALDAAAREVDEIVVVVGYRAEAVVEAVGDRHRDVPVRYARQPQPRGMVDAMACGGPALAGSDFLLLLGDVVALGSRYGAMISRFQREGLDGALGVLTVEDRSRIRQTLTLDVDDHRRIRRMLEKPETPFNDLMGTGEGVFRNEILQWVEQTPIDPLRNQKELVDLVHRAMAAGGVFEAFAVCDEYVNVNSLADLERAEALLHR